MKLNRRIRYPARPTLRPSLRFSPYAWGKLIYLRDRDETEIGGFGLSDTDDPLLITELLTIKQRCTPVTVAFDDGAVADLFDELVDQGIPPERFGRVWIHTHPGSCPLPSSTDEATFERIFGRLDWAVMAIVARRGARYARLSYHTGPRAALTIPVRVAYEQPFAGSDWEAWEREYVEHVGVEPSLLPPVTTSVPGSAFDSQFTDLWNWEELDGGAPHPGSF